MFSSSNKYDLLKFSKGWLFKLEGATWRVDNVNEYTWEEGEKTIEYEISSNERKSFLEVEDDEGKVRLYFSTEITAEQLNTNFEGLNHYDEVIYQSERYEYDETEVARFLSKTSFSSRGSVRCVSFYKKKKFVTVEYWDDDSIEYFAGITLKKNALSNIKPPHLI